MLMKEFEPRENLLGITDTVMDEIRQLQESGVDVEVTDFFDEGSLDEERQEFVNENISRLENSATGYDDFRAHSGIAAWSKLTKRAIALHTLYNPDNDLIGSNIDADIYDRPLFDGYSANELLIAQKKIPLEKALFWINAYKEFTETPIDDGSTDKVGSRDYFKGAFDARAVRTRAITAMHMAENSIISDSNSHNRNNLISASLACGAAGPVYNLVSHLEKKGLNFEKILLIDQDPMALATAQSLGEHAGLDSKIKLELKDLLSDNLTDYIEPNSVDIVDLLGLFEYIPNSEKHGKWCTALLDKVSEIIKPDGLILFGNMLNDRPQQTFFDNVVKWPRLHQRTISDVISILNDSGYSNEQISIRVPREGIYAVYSVSKKEKNAGTGMSNSVSGLLGKTALQPY